MKKIVNRIRLTWKYMDEKETKHRQNYAYLENSKQKKMQKHEKNAGTKMCTTKKCATKKWAMEKCATKKCRQKMSCPVMQLTLCMSIDLTQEKPRP